MPIGEIAGDALGGVARVLGRILFEIFFELMIKGVGYVLLRKFRPKAEASEAQCAVVGLLFWVAVAASGYWLSRQAAAA
ncbi:MULTISPECIES: hypothetical protein [unclassified Luteimonas]